MSLELIQTKRQILVVQRDQLLANLNMTIGAIAACDELLNEIARDQEMRKFEDARKGAEAFIRNNPSPPPAPANWTPPAPCDGDTAQQMADEVKARFCPPSAPPAMLPVSKFEPCEDCSTSDACDALDTCRYTAPDGDAA